MPPKSKHDWQLSRSEAASLLRALADTLEDGSDDVCHYGISLADLIKFKVKISLEKDDVLEVKFAGKGSASCGGEGTGGKGKGGDSFPSLKKRMQAHFATMRRSVSQGAMPSRDAVTAFLDDSAEMLNHPGYGDDAHYQIYGSLCARLESAFSSGDLAATAAALDELNQAKKTCHSRAK